MPRRTTLFKIARALRLSQIDIATEWAKITDFLTLRIGIQQPENGSILGVDELCGERRRL